MDESSYPSDDQSRELEKVRELEPRRGLGSATPEPPTAFAPPSQFPSIDKEFLPRIAIYLIEREAIELRRRRWTIQDNPEVGRLGAEGETLEQTNERLQKYERPKTTTERPAYFQNVLRIVRKALRDWRLRDE